MLLRRVLTAIWLLLFVYVLFFGDKWVFAQDVSTGAIRGVVQDPSGARIVSATVIVIDTATGVRRGLMTDEEGTFTAQLLPPATYRIRVNALGMVLLEAKSVLVELGSEVDLKLTLRVAGKSESVTVSDSPVEVATRSVEHAEVIDEKSVADLPLNGRRFSDLALLSPGIVTDPRGMTSASNGDLSSGGIRGFQTSYLVDGADNNNAFFSQARGRYRAPYQFSNEVVQEFRVNINNYGAELGRAGAVVINVVTRSGSNNFHGKAFYFLRDSQFNATQAGLDFKPGGRKAAYDSRRMGDLGPCCRRRAGRARRGATGNSAEFLFAQIGARSQQHRPAKSTRRCMELPIEDF